MAKQSHAVMTSALAKALIDAGVKHYDTGGDVGKAGAGALSGAAAGAAAGSVIPGIGTAIGAVGGAIIGGISAILSSNGPKPPNITDPVTGQQITDASGQVVASQQQIQAFTQNLSAQNGTQNQQDIYNKFGQVAAGQGPNPALDALRQATGQNVQAQAALAAGERGSGANVGLIARQAAQQGATTQQQAVGQAATLESQQQLSALGQQAGIAGQEVGELGSALNAGANTSLTNQGQVLGAQGQYNTTVAGGQENQNNNNATTNNTLLKGGLGALGGLGAGLAKGGGDSSSGATTTPAPVSASKGGLIGLPDHLQKLADIYHKGRALPMKQGGQVPGKAKVKGDSPKNDTVPALLSAGEEVLPRSVTQGPNAPQKAAEFVRHLQEQQGKKKDLKSRVEDLEKMFMGGLVHERRH